MIKFNLKNLKFEDIDFENLPQLAEDESGVYNIDLNIKNTNCCLLFDLIVTDGRTYDAGDYYTPPSVDGCIDIEIIDEMEIHNWDNDDTITFSNDKLCEELQDYIFDHYN